MKGKKRSLEKDFDLFTPKFKKALSLLEHHHIDDLIIETYENYIFTVDGVQCRFFKQGLVSQVQFIENTLNLLKQVDWETQINEQRGN